MPTSRQRRLSPLCSAMRLAVGLLLVCSAASAAESPMVAKFVTQHCADCHVGATAEGGLDLAALDHDLTDVARFARWERVYDRVRTGEMPPPDAPQPTAADRSALLAELGARLTAAHAAQKGTVLRRLNRREYENTLNDLFGTNLRLADRLPPDGRSHEFDNVGEALGISLVQMQRYLQGIEAVLDEATQKTLGPPEVKTVTASYAKTQGAEQWLGKIWLLRDDGAVVFFRATGYPSGMLREANVQRDGWYKIRVTGYAFQSEKPVTFSLGAQTFARGVEQPTFGYYSFPPGEPTTIEIKAWVPARYMIDVTPQGLFDRENVIQKKGAAGYMGPGLAVQSIEVEGPLVEQFPSRGHQLVFAGLERSEIPPRNPADRQRSYYQPKFEIKSSDPAADARQALLRVASRAFRRPATDEQIAPYLALFESERTAGATFEEALRTAVAAIFCAPDFLYLRELPRTAASKAAAAESFWLDDYSLATRLAYFLSRSAPDDELLAAAAGGKLSSDRAELLRQTERLLADPRSARFVTDFTDAWLNLREIEFTNPDGVLYPEFDRYLQFSLLDETRLYFRKLIDDNLGISHLVKSDFAILNERLAEHYGIAGVAGPHMRVVPLAGESVRGGLLAQGSVLKVSANGTNTSPVVRGVWVMDRLLAQPPQPPPPGIPGVEPDIRGASTLRELLDKHRNLDTCKGCHQKIDPPGFALESFDPIGGWRERFRSLGEGQKVDFDARGNRVRYKFGPPVDASGELAGKKFAGFVEFRELLAQDEAALARALAIKLLTFGTGRELGFSDRPEIERIVAESAKTKHGVGDLLKLVVTSEIFRRK
ncbi:MAG: DUF1592 domain-containing protein [Pirellulaceae bacterium]|nr:DUF1592 domain-containing protein [Pirellulaceae bacterium]